MAGMAADGFLRRHQMLSLSFWVTLLFAILFAMAAMDVTGQCYVDPCSAASPAVTGGASFVTALAAFLFIAQVRRAQAVAALHAQHGTRQSVFRCGHCANREMGCARVSVDTCDLPFGLNDWGLLLLLLLLLL